MRNLIIVLTLILLLTTSSIANSYYQELEITLDGDYTLNTSLTLPEVASVIDLVGVGKAFIKSKLIIVTDDIDSLKAWWELF